MADTARRDDWGKIAVVTVIAGPLNYLGVNPKVHHCSTPQPSK